MNKLIKKLIFTVLLFFGICINGFTQQWLGATTNDGYIYRTGILCIGGNYSNAKFSIKGTSNYSHFYYGTYEDVYLRPGTNSGSIIMDIGTLKCGHINMGIDKNLIIGANNSLSYFSISSAESYQQVYIGYKRNLYFKPKDNTSTASLILQENGNVGIGFPVSFSPTATHTGTYKLAVNGSIHAKSVDVDMLNWPDHVFNDNYNLLSIAELESYIKINKHLPNIPCEKEVKENGVNLGDVQSKLLQKVEELTLYVIQIKKENDELKEKISIIENINK